MFLTTSNSGLQYAGFKANSRCLHSDLNSQGDVVNGGRISESFQQQFFKFLPAKVSGVGLWGSHKVERLCSGKV